MRARSPADCSFVGPVYRQRSLDQDSQDHQQMGGTAMTTTTPQRNAEQPAETNRSRNAEQMSDPNDPIARRAYELYEQRGREPGADVDDWLQAERDVRES